MPTPVSTARQCLTEEAARALDDAVVVARRRSHAQTTSLHAVSALLGLPSSILREACARARSSAYSPRLQFRALELCVGVSLDRLPSSKALDEPPVSNSLMAAIKRSQANQRRQPETFHLYQQLQQQNPSSVSCVKVELKLFVVSILDDPIVSRVFGDAGFRSCDIKLAIISPPPISRFSRSSVPPLFLCNFSGTESNRPGFNFPFASFSGTENGDYNCRRIGEVLASKNSKRNPLLVGICAYDSLVAFTECVQKGKGGVFPAGIDALRIVCIEKEISEFSMKAEGEEMMKLKFKEVGEMVEHSTGPCIVVNYGTLKVFVDERSDVDAVNFVVSQLRSLVDIHGEKLRLVGSAESNDTYTKFLGRFPSIDEYWHLHLLPITSIKSPVGGFYSKSSLMGSFVPFGGFFPSSSEFESTFSGLNQAMSCCSLCNEKYEQEASVILEGGSIASTADQQSAGISSWLQMKESEANTRVGGAELAKDDGTVLYARIKGLQRKWNDICQRLNHSRPLQMSISQSRTKLHEGLHFVSNRVEISSKDLSQNESIYINTSPRAPIDMQHCSLLKGNVLTHTTSDVVNANFQPKLPTEGSRIQQFQVESSSWQSSRPQQGQSLPCENTSISSVTSVITDLGLGTLYSSSNQETRRPKFVGHEDCHRHLSGYGLAQFDGTNDNASHCITHSSLCSGVELGGQSDAKDFKNLQRALAERVSWQDEAIRSISQTISDCKSGLGVRRGSRNRGDIWLCLLGPDKVGKRKIARALAEISYGSRVRPLCVDLSSEGDLRHPNSMFGLQSLNSHDLMFRGKTVVDYIAEELNKKCHPVVLLENIDKADFLAQDSLSKAIKTGKFPDTHGREFSIKSTIFVMTSRNTMVDKHSILDKQRPEFSEDRILGAKCLQMQISVGSTSGRITRKNSSNVFLMPAGVSSPASGIKRKRVESSNSLEQDNAFEIQKKAFKQSRSSLDLNLPVEEMEDDNDYGSYNSESGSENSKAWLDDFLDQADGRVIFRPIDFDALAQTILKEITLSFHKEVGTEVLLEIDPEVMVQILAAAWLSDGKRAVDEWVRQVLSRSFVDARQRYCLAAHSVVKLAIGKGLVMEEQDAGVCLPARVVLD